MPSVTEKTRWGTTLGTASATIDEVMMFSKGCMSLRNIERLSTKKCLERGLKPRRKASPHLTELSKRGVITKDGHGIWRRVWFGG